MQPLGIKYVCKQDFFIFRSLSCRICTQLSVKKDPGLKAVGPRQDMLHIFLNQALHSNDALLHFQDRFDFDTDPVSWFYQNQIKSEEDFQARKAELRAEARRRLDAVSPKIWHHLIFS